MPYLLSSIDRGRGMVQMLNQTPIDYVTWGNHEADLSHQDRDASYGHPGLVLRRLPMEIYTKM